MKIQTFDFSINVLSSLLWRHNEAENLQALIQYKQDAIDELNEDFWNDWVVNVFNLQTANQFGLSVWSIILNFPLTIITPDQEEVPGSNFGFGQYRKNFDNGNFTGNEDSVTLVVEDARTILKLIYYKLMIRPTVNQINAVLQDVFPGNLAYVEDNLDMTIDYVFTDYISAGLRKTIETFDVLPRPSGVELNSITYGP